MTTIIIGAGITGLTAARLVDDDVIVLEKNRKPGGLCASYHVNEAGRDYYIEDFYHHFFDRDTALISLCEELGVQVEWWNSTSGYSYGSKVYPLNTPAQILSYPYLTLIEKFRLAMFTLKCKNEDPSKFKDVRASDYVVNNVGVSVYEKFFLPLLKSKYGEDHDDISASWIIVRVKLRSKRNAKGEMLGYVSGGFQNLVDSLAESVRKKGGRVETGREVRDIVIRDGKVAGVRTDEGVIECDRVICTSPALTAKYAGLPKNTFHGVLCTLYGLKRPVTPVYWVNIADDASFRAMIEHTNFLPVEKYGENLLYVTNYTSKPVDVVKDAAAYRSDLSRFGVSEEDILWERSRYEKYAAPVYRRSYVPLPYASDKVEGLYFAGIFSPPSLTGRIVDSAVVTGKEVAEIVNNGMKA